MRVLRALTRYAAPMLATVMCSGCYPSIAIVRPALDLAVREAQSDPAVGAPIPDARVTLATYSPDGPHFEYFTTDATGRLKLRARREPTVRVVLGDYFWDQRWALCVEKPGYLAAAVGGLSADGKFDLHLTPSTLASSCEWPREYGNLPRVVTR